MGTEELAMQNLGVLVALTILAAPFILLLALVFGVRNLIDARSRQRRIDAEKKAQASLDAQRKEMERRKEEETLEWARAFTRSWLKEQETPSSRLPSNLQAVFDEFKRARDEGYAATRDRELNDEEE